MTKQGHSLDQRVTRLEQQQTALTEKQSDLGQKVTKQADSQRSLHEKVNRLEQRSSNSQNTLQSTGVLIVYIVHTVTQTNLLKYSVQYHLLNTSNCLIIYYYVHSYFISVSAITDQVCIIKIV